MKIKHLIQPVAVSVSLALFAMGCSDSSSSSAGSQFDDSNSGTQPPATGFNEQALVTHLTDNVITPHFESFEELAGELHTVVDSFCQSEQGFNLGSVTEQVRDQQKVAAQDQWKQAMSEWQIIEVMQIGPLAENQNSLRNRIYSWPVVNNCAVDQDVVFFNQGNIGGSPYNIANRTVTRRGLDALEYLLFNTNLDHACSAGTEPDGWDQLADAQRREQRCAYATEVADDLSNNAQTLLNEWNGADGYATSLRNASTQAGSDFNNVHEAVNRISDGLFYVDTTTKDAKLAIPVGLFENDCQQNACPENLESQFAHHSLENIRSNLIGLKSIFTGEVANSSETIGFDDFLVEEGAESVANNISNAIDNAISNVDLYQVSLNETLLTTPNQAQLTHDQIKVITDQLKTDFINELALQLPASSAGDND